MHKQLVFFCYYVLDYHHLAVSSMDMAQSLRHHFRNWHQQYYIRYSFLYFSKWTLQTDFYFLNDVLSFRQWFLWFILHISQYNEFAKFIAIRNLWCKWKKNPTCNENYHTFRDILINLRFNCLLFDFDY